MDKLVLSSSLGFVFSVCATGESLDKQIYPRKLARTIATHTHKIGNKIKAQTKKLHYVATHARLNSVFMHIYPTKKKQIQ